ncbi:MAG: hypothetical protein ACYDCD_07950 [Candidatus Acidiferrales bacterium]
MPTSPAAKPQNSQRRIHPNASAANLARHAAVCRVCNHPSRAAIEFDFLNWRNPFDLVKSYHLRNISTIYRHAHATGLFSRRRLNLRFALERIVERVSEVPVTANAVIRSIRAITRINDAGEWVDPPARVIISREDSAKPRRNSSRRNSSRATQKSAPPAAPIFEPALLEEPPAEQVDRAEQPAARVGEKPPASPQTYEIVLSPEFAAAHAARRLGLAIKNPAFGALEKELAAAQALQSSIANEMRSPEEPND